MILKDALNQHYNTDKKPVKKYEVGGRVISDEGETNDAKKGGYFDGRPHSKGGIKGVNIDTGAPIEVEGGEVVITKKAVSDDTKREFEGKMMTNKEILSEINESGGGVSFEKGGEVETDDLDTIDFTTMNFGKEIFDKGGYVNNDAFNFDFLKKYESENSSNENETANETFKEQFRKLTTIYDFKELSSRTKIATAAFENIDSFSVRDRNSNPLRLAQLLKLYQTLPLTDVATRATLMTEIKSLQKQIENFNYGGYGDQIQNIAYVSGLLPIRYSLENINESVYEANEVVKEIKKPPIAGISTDVSNWITIESLVVSNYQTPFRKQLYAIFGDIIELNRLPFSEIFAVIKDWNCSKVLKPFIPESAPLPSLKDARPYMIPYIVYSGSGQLFNSFSFSRFPIVYFARNIDYANWFAQNGERPTIYQCYLDIRFPLDMSSFGIKKITPKTFFLSVYLQTGITPDKFNLGKMIDSDVELYVWQFFRSIPAIIEVLKKESLVDGLHFFENNPAVDQKDAAYQTEVWCPFRKNQIFEAGSMSGNALVDNLGNRPFRGIKSNIMWLNKGGKI